MTHKTYERELQTLKSWDEVQYSYTVKGLQFINTAGHGYLVIPVNHPQYAEAQKQCRYGFKGTRACYLEEDCEAPAFLRHIGALTN